MKKLHIGVDLDDVTLDFMPGVMASFEREFGMKPAFDGDAWGPSAVAFTKHPRFQEAGYDSWWDWLRDREWLWATFGTVPGAIGGIKTLRAAGHYVECVTSKPAWAEHNVWRWMGRWRPPFQRVTVVETGKRKIDFTDATVMVDDKRQTVDEFRAAGRTGILFDRSKKNWNWGEIENRVAIDWDEVLWHVEEIARGD